MLVLCPVCVRACVRVCRYSLHGATAAAAAFLSGRIHMVTKTGKQLCQDPSRIVVLGAFGAFMTLILCSVRPAVRAHSLCSVLYSASQGLPSPFSTALLLLLITFLPVCLPDALSHAWAAFETKARY